MPTDDRRPLTHNWTAVWQKGDSRRSSGSASVILGWGLISRNRSWSPQKQVLCRTCAESSRVGRNFERNHRRMRRAERWIGGLSAAGLAALLSACAGVPRDASLPIDDPNEQFNRGVLRANQVVLDPVANVVKAAPAPVRNRLRDLDDNLKEPRIFANDILQGRFDAAGITLGRFVFNSIFGLGGLFDVATRRGVAEADRRFWPDHVRLGRPCGPLCRATLLSVPRRCAIRSAAPSIRWATRSAGWLAGLYWLAVVGRLGAAVSAVAASRPMERGRERLDRLLQLPAVGFLSDPPGGLARGARLAARSSSRRPRQARSRDRRPPYGRS